MTRVHQKATSKQRSSEETAKRNMASKCASACHANDRSVTTSALIVPVWLHHKDDPQKELQVYAVLDDQSDTCFVTNEVCKKLGLEGPTVTLELGTMHAVEKITTSKINGLVISCRDKLVKIELLKSYTRDQISARKEQIPRPERAQGWSTNRQQLRSSNQASRRDSKKTPKTPTPFIQLLGGD